MKVALLTVSQTQLLRIPNDELRSLTNGQKDAIVLGESQALHRPHMVSDGNTAFSV